MLCCVVVRRAGGVDKRRKGGERVASSVSVDCVDLWRELWV